jgi:ribonucleoside-diphosphate reductase beta chain
MTSVYLVNKGESLNNLLKVEDEYSYKPFKYPEAYNFYSVHEDLHWTKKEIDLSSDVKDWNTKATDVDKFLITNILRTFTTNEVAVGSGYDAELRIFKRGYFL